MWRKVALILLVCTISFSVLPSCAREQHTQLSTTQSDEDIRWVCPPTVIIDGREYRDWSIIRPNITIKDEDVLGYITSVVSITEMPTQNNEANYDAVLNQPYARWTDEEYGEVYVIWHDYGWKAWYILLPADYKID